MWCCLFNSQPRSTDCRRSSPCFYLPSTYLHCPDLLPTFTQLSSSLQIPFPPLWSSLFLTSVSGRAEVFNTTRIPRFGFPHHVLCGSSRFLALPGTTWILLFGDFSREFAVLLFYISSYFVKSRNLVLWLNENCSLQACRLNSWSQLVMLLLEAVEDVGVGAAAGSWSLGLAFEGCNLVLVLQCLLPTHPL